jgi:asparagine synthetase B (glutamine-hydrolysing)
MRKARPPDRRMKLHCYRRSEDRAYWDRLNQALYIDMQLLLSGNNLVKPDRMGMAVSLEARTPFLDYRMMEFAFRMPGHFKLREGVAKYLFKKAVAPRSEKTSPIAG